MTTLVTPAALARSRPATSASYSASLLVVGKSRRTIHSIVSPLGDNSTMSATPAYLLDDLSVCMLHWGDSSASLSSSWVNSAMKSAMICPLMTVRERYWMSNLLNSMAYSANQPAALGLLIACRRGLSIRTITMWAWKYGLSLRAVITNAKVSFSIGGYLSSAPRSAWLA